MSWDFGESPKDTLIIRKDGVPQLVIHVVEKLNWEVFNTQTTQVYVVMAHWCPQWIAHLACVVIAKLTGLPVDYARDGEGY